MSDRIPGQPDAARAIRRREFLRTASIATGALAAGRAVHGVELAAAVQEVRISSARYTPRDYPIGAKRFTEVTLKDQFWKPKVDRNAAVTIPLLAARSDGRGLSGNTLEAAILSLESHPNPELQKLVEARIAALQSRPERGNSGFEVAVAYFNATGRRELLDRAITTAAALHSEFQTTNPPFSGGERDAINCLQLYRVTHDRTHLDLAKHYLDIRGLPNSLNRSRHNQSYKPVLEQSEAVGHAVNGITLMLSMLEVGVLTGLDEYAAAAERMWTDIVSRKMYVTGGAGSTGNEGFGAPYWLPNISAYAETCAVLMFATLNHRLFLRTGDSQYIDVLERGIYNNALSGVSVSGDRFFYVNRLASAGDGRDTRWARASLECCPPNLVRFLAQMPGYIYAQGGDGSIYVNLYVSSTTKFAVNGSELSLAVESEMPWGGRTTIAVTADSPVKAALKVRMPGWTSNRPAPGGLYTYEREQKGGTVSVNGRPVAGSTAKGYVILEREWRSGDRVDVAFPMNVRRVIADERVRDDRGRVAIEQGPFVYCVEGPDAAGKSVAGLMLEKEAALTPSRDETLFGGATVIAAQARESTNPGAAAVPIRMIPYHLWANRGASEMSVWLPTREYAVGDVGPAGGLIFYVNPDFARDGWRYLEAASVDQSVGAKWGCFRTLIAGATGMAIGTGRQNTKDMLAACADRGTAADLCANYVLNGVGGWFLPSRDELSLMYRNLKAQGVGDFRDQGLADNCEYWTSSQETADMANHVDFADNGRLHYDDKDFPRRVRAIRAF
jgi:uncharacterized protein